MVTNKSLVRAVALLFFLSVSSRAPVVEGQLPANFEEQVEELVNIFREKNRTPAVTLAVVHSDGLFSFTEGYGQRDIEKDISATSQSLTAIASISKSFAAVIVSKILNEKFPNLGESALDTPIIKLSPSLNFSLSDRARSESLSFRDLLSHRTCISPSTLGRTMGAFSKDEYIYRTRYAPEVCPFRTGYTYNNAMFALAGELIAQINGTKNYETTLSNFLKELGMDNSKVVSNTENYGTLENMATPYYINEQGNLTRMNPDLIRRGHVSLGSGGVITSAQDMVRYLMFRLNNGRLDNKQIVPASVLNWTKKPSNPFNFNGFETDSVDQINGDFAYALGLNIGFFNGRQLISHDGFWTPYASRMSLFPSLKLGLFSSTNGPGRLQGPSFTSLHNAIVSLIEDPSEFEDIKERLSEEKSKKKSSKKRKNHSNNRNIIRVEPKDAAGVYGNPFHGDLQIVYNVSDPNGELSLIYGIWGRGYLRSLSSSNILSRIKIDHKVNLDPQSFVIDWTSDIIGEFLATSDSVPNAILSFTDPNTLDLDLVEITTYKRDATLNTLPDIPWAADSCSP